MTAKLHPTHPADEEGMTLIELVISIALLGIVIGPVTAMILLGFLSSDGTRDKIADSVSAQLVSSYVVTDIQSADVVSPGQTGCSVPGTGRLRLTWNNPANLGQQTTVVYYERTGSSGQQELHRASCGPDGNTSTLLVNYLGNMAVSCTPACGTLPDKVTVSITAESTDPQSDAYYQPFDFTVDAHPRSEPGT